MKWAVKHVRHDFLRAPMRYAAVGVHLVHSIPMFGEPCALLVLLLVY